MKERIEKIMKKPVVAHAMAANERYIIRMGPQFAGAITYFSVLSMLPMLMFAFAMLGMTLTVFRPDLLVQIKTSIDDFIGDTALADSVGVVVTQAFQNWRSLTTVAILTAAYSGSMWAGNLKRAVRVMWSENASDAVPRANFFLELLRNLMIFLGLLLCLMLGLGIASIGSTFSHYLIEWLGWEQIPGIGLLWQAVALLLSFITGWILFAFIFVVLPHQPVRPKYWLLGTLLGALAVTLLQAVAGRLVGVFSNNPTASVFGPVIIMMLVFNLLATIILMVAAWVGTEQTWAADLARKDAEQAQQAQQAQRPQVEEPGEPAAEAVGAPSRWAATRTAEELRDPATGLPEISSETTVRQDVAARGMRVNWGLGYGIGAATGLGLGALIAGGLRKLVSWRSRR